MGMAERIKKRRIELGLTQEELGEKIGLQKSAIAKYENGRVENIKRSVILSMSSALQCNPSYLLDLEEKTKDMPKQFEFYLTEATKDIAKEIYENKELYVLFQNAKDASPEDLKTVNTMLLALKSKNAKDGD